MLLIRRGGVRIRICFGFFAVLTLYYYLYGRDGKGITAALTACILHELGHLAVMLILGERPREVCFYALGIRILPPRRKPSRQVMTAVLSAGCAVNLMLAGACLAAGAEELMYVNLAVGALNIMPFAALDGGRIMSLWLPERVRRASAAAAAAALAAVCVLAGSPCAALMIGAFAAAAEFPEGRFTKNLH